ncbi:MAG: TIGR01244 family sulfur transferase [Gammaproteobacteria bacterium]|nr:TIGR01244 family sulfur transferase [Gammaproteobacteria bacterium]
MKTLYRNILVAGQIDAATIKQLKELGISTIINNRPDGEEPGQLTANEDQVLARVVGVEYLYLPMANGRPLPENLVEDFRNAVDNAEGNVLAHCRSGMRSSFIWALGAIAAGEVDVDQAINAAQNAGIPLQNARSVLQSIT